MHVAIKQTVLDRILKRIGEIKLQNREPEYVVVSHEEYDELRSDRRMWRYTAPCPSLLSQYRHSVADVSIRTREFPLRDSHRGRPDTHPFIRTYSRETFMDLPLYVVPSEYMPA